MKKILYRAVLSVVAVFGVAVSASAQAYLQDPKYGSSPEQRQETVLNINYFNDAYKSKDYGRAAELLQKIIAVAPAASQNIYINGINIYREKAAGATVADQRKLYTDSLMMLYNLRIENFGSDAGRQAYLLGLKARDYLALYPEDKELVKTLFTEAINAAGDDADPELINIYFNALVDAYKADKIATEVLLSEYDRLSKIYEQSTAEGKDEGKKTLDALFVSSGAASCDNLEKVYRSTIEGNPDVATLKKVFHLLVAGDCKNDFMILVGGKYYTAEPTSEVALFLASSLEEKSDYVNARKYLNEAIANESDPATKANLAVRIAGGELAQNHFREAADFARQAIDFDPNNGYAYTILGNAYAGGAQSCSGFDRQTAYWLVVDILSKAKDLLANDPAQQEKLNTSIAGFRAGFPSDEEGFFRGLENGQAYTVNCGWVSGRTTVRLIKK